MTDYSRFNLYAEPDIKGLQMYLGANDQNIMKALMAANLNYLLAKIPDKPPPKINQSWKPYYIMVPMVWAIWNALSELLDGTEYSSLPKAELEAGIIAILFLSPEGWERIENFKKPN